MSKLGCHSVKLVIDRWHPYLSNMSRLHLLNWLNSWCLGDEQVATGGLIGNESGNGAGS